MYMGIQVWLYHQQCMGVEVMIGSAVTCVCIACVHGFAHCMYAWMCGLQVWIAVLVMMPTTGTVLFVLVGHQYVLRVVDGALVVGSLARQQVDCLWCNYSNDVGVTFSSLGPFSAAHIYTNASTDESGHADRHMNRAYKNIPCDSHIMKTITTKNDCRDKQE